MLRCTSEKLPKDSQKEVGVRHAISKHPEVLLRFVPGPQPLPIRLIATIALVLAAFGFRYAIREGTGQYGFIHFVLPILVASIIFDKISGFFAVLLSMTLIGSLLTWDASGNAHIIAMTIFLIVGSCLVFIADGLRRALEKSLQAEVAADLLLQEMSHRVKNKFAMISSMIWLQARTASPEVQAALAEVAARVDVMATIHNYLQRSRHEGLIDMSEYLPSLCNALKDALCGPRPIILEARAVPTQFPPDKALATGLIANELVTNAFKYAFEADQPGCVNVELRRTEGSFELIIADNGRGRDIGRVGFGSRLVDALSTQLGGEVQWSVGKTGGCCATITFPASDPVPGTGQELVRQHSSP